MVCLTPIAKTVPQMIARVLQVDKPEATEAPP